MNLFSPVISVKMISFIVSVNFVRDRKCSPDIEIIIPFNRYGQCGKGDDTSTAYNGTNSKAYFHTPVTFFSGNEKNPDKADTSRTGGVCVLTRDVSAIKNVSGDPKNVHEQDYPWLPKTNVMKFGSIQLKS